MKHEAIIVGAGIAGLSLAWNLRRQGINPLILERSARAVGASIRNFGMVWPVGHPVGEWRALALRSRELWLEVAAQAGIWRDPRGSLTLAYEEVEEAVLREFLASVPDDGWRPEFISAEQALEINGKIRPEGLRGAMLSRSEVCVDPREVVDLLAEHLRTAGLDIRFGVSVASAESGRVFLADGGSLASDRIFLCAGPDVRSLSPEAADRGELRPCALQMMRLRPKASEWPKMGAHLCAGLTLGHYANFRTCPSLPLLLERHRQKWPRQQEFGIHVLVSQHADGSLTVGDSHDYGDPPLPFRREEIDDAILEALDEFLDVSEFEIAERWIGRYNTSPGRFYSWVDLAPGVSSLNLFGTGMTLSFGVTEKEALRLLSAS